MGVAEKNSARLTIVIQEHEHAILNADNTIARFDPRGRVIIRNESRTYSIWDAELELNRPNRTTLGSDALEIGRLDPLSEWEKEFIVKEVEMPMLLVTEVVDSFYERVGVNNAVVYDYEMPVEFTLSLRNHSGANIRKIEVKKEVPPIFQKIQLQKTQIGKVKYDTKEGQITWNIDELQPDRMAVQRVRAIINVQDTQPIATGKVHVRYHIPGVVRSLLVPTLHGTTESEVSVEKEEHTMRAGTWRCKANLTNSSDFPIRLQRVQIVMTAPESELLYEGTPNLRLEHDEVWGHEFEVSADQPQFDIITLSTVEAPLVQEIVGTIEKEANILQVLRIEGTKKIEPVELLAWEPTPVAVTLSVRNSGTIECDEVIFKDQIPPGFEPPENTQIRVRIKDRPITRSVDVQLRPSTRDWKEPHTIIIDLHDLTEVQAAVQPGDTVTTNYIMIARVPKPNHEYSPTLTIEANTFPPGPPASIVIPETAIPKIRVRATARKLRKTRTVSPGEKAGELIVTVTFVNESETSLQEPELQDLIPPNFVFIGVPQGAPEPITRETMNGTLMSWSLPSMMSREKFVARYTYRPKA